MALTSVCRSYSASLSLYLSLSLTDNYLSKLSKYFFQCANVKITESQSKQSVTNLHSKNFHKKRIKFCARDTERKGRVVRKVGEALGALGKSVAFAKPLIDHITCKFALKDFHFSHLPLCILHFVSLLPTIRIISVDFKAKREKKPKKNK